MCYMDVIMREMKVWILLITDKMNMYYKNVY